MLLLPLTALMGAFSGQATFIHHQNRLHIPQCYCVRGYLWHVLHRRFRPLLCLFFSLFHSATVSPIYSPQRLSVRRAVVLWIEVVGPNAAILAVFDLRLPRRWLTARATGSKTSWRLPIESGSVVHLPGLLQGRILEAWQTSELTTVVRRGAVEQ